MKRGQVINGYRILRDFSVVEAGLSKWTFAERDGQEFFLKEFLAPTYPEDDGPGSPKTKEAKRARCAAFEQHHRRIMEATRRVSGPGGNLVVTVDFFRWGSKYYKVTEKIEAAGLEVPDIAVLPIAHRLIICKAGTHSVKILHGLGIVHGDLKPPNALIKKTERAYTAKLIDFDSSFFEGEAPVAAEIVGTPEYYSPELLRYVQTDGATSAPGRQADIFVLGIMFSQYLTGRRPAFDIEEHTYPCVAALNGVVLTIPDAGLPEGFPTLVSRMLLADPAARPTIGDVHRELLAIRPGRSRSVSDGHGPARVAPGGRSMDGAAVAPALRGKGLRTVRPPEPIAAGLKGKLVRPAEPDRR